LNKILGNFFIFILIIYLPEAVLLMSESVFGNDRPDYLKELSLFAESIDGLQFFLFIIILYVTIIKIYKHEKEIDSNVEKLSKEEIDLKKEEEYNKKRNQEILESRKKHINF
tara:strand:+ start:20595 stop:20930 length:336 start_codon:yes stop_codon:yes gene_type:complete